MKEVIPGHIYELDNLKSEGRSELRFFMDPALHGSGHPGPSTQEVIRACIARVVALDEEKPWAGNAVIIAHLRFALALFEVRALLRKVEKGEPIEEISAGPDGHVFR